MFVCFPACFTYTFYMHVQHLPATALNPHILAWIHFVEGSGSMCQEIYEIIRVLIEEQLLKRIATFTGYYVEIQEHVSTVGIGGQIWPK